jgi:hypothetical protein
MDVRFVGEILGGWTRGYLPDEFRWKTDQDIHSTRSSPGYGDLWLAALSIEIRQRSSVERINTVWLSLDSAPSPTISCIHAAHLSTT